MQIEKADLVIIRDGIEDDRSFIFSTFLRGLFYGDSWFSQMPKNLFMQNYHKILEALLDRSEIKVACLKEDPQVILGYAILSKTTPTLHWCFVKSAWRGIGIAKSLVPKETKVATHLTKVGLSIMKKRPEMVFNPFDV